MFRTIRGRVTINVILIVVAMIIILASTILTVMGNKLTDKMELELQLRSDRYANEINAWFSEEKMLVTDAARAVEAAGNVDAKTVQSVVDTYYQGRPELLNLYLGKEDHSFYQGNREATIPEGYDPCERGWYKSAKEAKETIVTDPYWDVLTGQMCGTIAAPIYLNDELAGVVAIDMTLGTVTDLVKSVNYEKGVYAFLVDSSDNIVAHQNADYEPTEESATPAVDVVPELKPILEEPSSATVKAVDYDGDSTYFVTSVIEQCNWKIGVTNLTSNFYKDIIRISTISIIITIVLIIILIAVLLVMIRKMLAPIAALKQFATGDFSDSDITTVEQGVPSEYKNETEQIMEATTKVKGQIRDIILTTKDESGSIKNISDDAVSEMADLKSHITEINTSVEEIVQSTREPSQLTDNINSTGDELEDAINQVACKASEAALQSKDIMNRATDLYNNSLESSRGTTNIYNGTKNELEKAIEGSKAVDEISVLTDEILSISAQTNLLALNASIEAARAGEAGKGFAVVADEIRVLADNTKQAVDKIQSVTEGIVRSVNDLSNNSNKLLEFMNDRVLVDYENMNSVAKQYQEDAIFYSTVSSELGSSSEQMSINMSKILDMIKSIAELTDSISLKVEEINEESVQSDTNSDEVLEQLKNLSSLSDSLIDTVAAFRV